MSNELKELKQALQEQKEKDMTWEEKMLAKKTSDMENVGFGKQVLKRRKANKNARQMRKQNKK